MWPSAAPPRQPAPPLPPAAVPPRSEPRSAPWSLVPHSPPVPAEARLRRACRRPFLRGRFVQRISALQPPRVNSHSIIRKVQSCSTFLAYRLYTRSVRYIWLTSSSRANSCVSFSRANRTNRASPSREPAAPQPATALQPHPPAPTLGKDVRHVLLRVAGRHLWLDHIGLLLGLSRHRGPYVFSYVPVYRTRDVV